MIGTPKERTSTVLCDSEKLLRYRQDGRALFQPEPPRSARTAIALLRCVSRKVLRITIPFPLHS
jgi:hypothetical protein